MGQINQDLMQESITGIKLLLIQDMKNVNGKGYRRGSKEANEYLNGSLKYNITDNHSLKF